MFLLDKIATRDTLNISENDARARKLAREATPDLCLNLLEKKKFTKTWLQEVFVFQIVPPLLVLHVTGPACYIVLSNNVIWVARGEKTRMYKRQGSRSTKTSLLKFSPKWKKREKKNLQIQVASMPSAHIMADMYTDYTLTM